MKELVTVDINKLVADMVKKLNLKNFDVLRRIVMESNIDEIEMMDIWKQIDETEDGVVSFVKAALLLLQSQTDR